MRKLKLDVNNLEVTSFDASTNPPAERGTVQGHKTAPAVTADGSYTCDGSETCYQTCADTCQGTCSGGVCGSWPLTYCPQCYYA
ncbi:MAG TPA: hypothetical protein VGC13_10455 [Longimicrobium sp.]|jgi:hypothetical protein|uniref:hypothetical protein n=1 Tax=Longimicrobium sp. TaxID=2029185 RepID=UPI002ED9C197